MFLIMIISLSVIVINIQIHRHPFKETFNIKTFIFEKVNGYLQSFNCKKKKKKMTNTVDVQ